MAKIIRKVNRPYRDRLLNLSAGILGGLLAGAGVSFLITSQQYKRHAIQNRNGSKRNTTESTREPRQSSSSARRTNAARRRSKPAGAGSSGARMTPGGLQAQANPGTNEDIIG